jgi:type II secretory ATPase GspE/PulE/Tfp pilus assembly ATPase PilB-like protein
VPANDEILALAEEYCAGTVLNPLAVIGQWKKTYITQAGGFLLHAAGGCSECDGNGYKGRMGLYEFLEAKMPIKKLIQHQATVEELQGAAIAQGMRTLKQAGIELVLQGHTNINQVRAVCN